MDYTEIFDKLKQASLFDLHRICSGLQLIMDDPRRNNIIKKHLSLNSYITFFDNSQNKLVDGIITEIRQKTVLLYNKDLKKQWVIPFYMLNVDGVDTDIQSTDNSFGLSKEQIKIGQLVCFVDKNGIEQYGEVIRLNPKTVTLKVGVQKWRVSYSFLSSVIDGEFTPYRDISSIEIIKDIKYDK